MNHAKERGTAQAKNDECHGQHGEQDVCGDAGRQIPRGAATKCSPEIGGTE